MFLDESIDFRRPRDIDFSTLVESFPFLFQPFVLLSFTKADYLYVWLSHANQNSTLRDQLKVIFRKASERKTVQTALNENN